LVRDFAALLDDKFADFVFKVENEKIPAHRVILAARSPVFAAMFQHDMQENKTNETDVTDVTPDAFKALLRFIYTGHCEVGMLTEDLFMAAIKYDIQDLIQICAKEMVKKLTADNAVRLLIVSDLHQAEDLKEAAMNFITKNGPFVMRRHSWTAFSKTHPNLISEIYFKLLFKSK
jgi:speckle-type POZ protein